MPKVSIYRKKLIDKKKKEAIQLYRQGLSLRAVGRIVSKSHEWVRKAVSNVDNA